MRRMLIVTLAVLAASIALCAACQAVLNGAVDRADALRSAAVLAAQEHRIADAKSLVLELAQYWKDRSAALELLASHDALHEVQSSIAEAQICLECEDRDDFLRTMSQTAQGLAHLRDEEALRLSNLY